MKAMKKKKIEFILFKDRYSMLVHGLLFGSFLAIMLFGVINQTFFAGKLPESYFYIAGVISGVLQIINGIIMIVHKEVPRTGGFSSITGIPAVIIGIIYLLVFGFIFTGGLIFYLVTHGL